MNVMWDGENMATLEKIFEPFKVELIQDGTNLFITGADDLEAIVQLGDKIKFRHGGFGIERLETDRPEQVFIWDGGNFLDARTFASNWPKIELSVEGNELVMDWIEERDKATSVLEMRQNMRAILHPGDRLIARGTYLFVSRAGVDHRA